MCGRFSLTTPKEVLVEAFDLDEEPQLAPRYNIAPSQPVALVRPAGARRRLGFARWGLVPAGSSLRPMINARSETAGRTPSFREAFAQRRCLVPANAFYEWRPLPASRTKQPYLIRLEPEAVFAFAGLWEPAAREGEPETCAILTSQPNELVRDIHDRMPVILPTRAYDTWLSGGSTQDSLQALLRPFPAEAMTAFPISQAINDPANDGPDCIEPGELQGRLF